MLAALAELHTFSPVPSFSAAEPVSRFLGGPADLLLVRHGQSEANAAKSASRRGDDALYTDAYRARPSAQQRLTERGRAEAVRAGVLLARTLDGPVHALTSPFVRALETAGHLGLDLEWSTEVGLREQGWGDLDALTESERRELHGPFLARTSAGELSARPPGGESLAEVSDRTAALLARWCLSHDGHTLLALTHEKVMWSLRLHLDHLPAPEWERRFAARKRPLHPGDALGNGVVVQYTRRDPTDPEAPLAAALRWRRISELSGEELSWGSWEELAPRTLSEAELRAEAVRHAPLHE